MVKCALAVSGAMFAFIAAVYLVAQGVGLYNCWITRGRFR